MKLLALAILTLAGVEARRFGEICWQVNVTNTGTMDDRVWTLEGICGKYKHKKRETLDLDQCVGNENGALVWRKEYVISYMYIPASARAIWASPILTRPSEHSGSFSSTCERCVGYERGPNVWLQCSCTKKDGEQAMLDEYPMFDLSKNCAPLILSIPRARDDVCRSANTWVGRWARLVGGVGASVQVVTSGGPVFPPAGCVFISQNGLISFRHSRMRATSCVCCVRGIDESEVIPFLLTNGVVRSPCPRPYI